MVIGNDGSVRKHLRTLYRVGTIGDLTDGQLLERFTTDRGEAAELAFTILVERHGPMVLRVCRGVLIDPHDAQDAFQATFLVLVRKSRALWVRDSLGPWLHQVAYRTASCARLAAARRRRHERFAASLAKEGRTEARDDLGRALHEEIERLPARYQAPLVLCDLEGCTHEQAARHLGWPIGTVKSRLSRGRDRLRDRLARRGLAPNAGLLAAAPRLDGPVAPIPPELADSTIRAAVQYVTVRTLVPGSAASLALEVLRSMSLSLGLKAATVLLVLGATVSGAGLLSQEGTTADRGEARAEGARKATPDDEKFPAEAEVKPGKFRVTVEGRGVVEASQAPMVFCQFEGNTTIKSILPEGTKVKKGEIVCELDSSRFQGILKTQKFTTQRAEAAYQSARRAREIAELAVTEYIEGIYRQESETIKGEIARAESAQKKAEYRLERSRRALQRMKATLAKMSNQGEALTPADIMAELDLEDRLDAAEEALDREKMALEQARMKRKVLEQFTRDKTVKELQSEVEKAMSDELAKQQTFELEKDKVARLERQIKSCTLLAPGDGVVVYANTPPGPGGFSPNMVKEGGIVHDRQKIFSVADLSGPMRVNAKMPESMVDRLKPGQQVQINVDAFSQGTLARHGTLAGVVQDVAPLPDPARPSDSGKKFYTTMVVIEEGQLAVTDQAPDQEATRRFQRLRRDLRPGMTADVEVLIKELDDVISVPIGALFRDEERYYVAVKIKEPGDGFEWREVVLGDGNESRVEVKQGLRSGDVVILDPRPLSEKFPPARHATEGSGSEPPG